MIHWTSTFKNIKEEAGGLEPNGNCMNMITKNKKNLSDYYFNGL